MELIAFSGGECFLLGDDLTQAIQYASDKGFRTRCVTNGFWAKSMRSGRRRLCELRDAGLDELNISTGDYHQEYVSEKTVVNAAILSLDLSLSETLIVIELQADRRVTIQSFLKNHPELRSFLNVRGDSFKIIESPWMPMNLEHIIHQKNGQLLNYTNLSHRHGCRSIFTTLVVNPDRQLGLCCGLSRELITELNIPLEAPIRSLFDKHSFDFMKIWIFVDGPEKILAWASSKCNAIKWQNKYSHQCHTCLAIYRDELVRKTILRHYKERVDDVLIRYNMLVKKQRKLEISMPN